MLEVSLHRCVFKSNLLKHIIKLSEDQVLLVSGGWLRGHLIWLRFVLFLYLVNHCGHNAPDTGRPGLHVVDCAIEIFEVPLTRVIVDTVQLCVLDFGLETHACIGSLYFLPGDWSALLRGHWGLTLWCCSGSLLGSNSFCLFLGLEISCSLVLDGLNLSL